MGARKLSYYDGRTTKMVVFSKKRGQKIFFDRSKSALDYSPYGMQMLGRQGTLSGGEYRYAFKGMETDKEVSGNGNSYTTQFRQYDPRLGRWKSLDPLAGKYPNQSPFNAFNDNPLYFTDPLGLEGEPQKGTKDNPHEVSSKEEGAKVLDGLKPDKNGNIDDQYIKMGNDLYRARYDKKNGSWTYYKRNGSEGKGYSWVKGGTYKTKTKSAPGSSTTTGESKKTSGSTGTNTQKTSNPSNTGANNEIDKSLTATKSQPDELNYFDNISSKIEYVLVFEESNSNQPTFVVNSDNSDDYIGEVLNTGGATFGTLEYLVYNEELGYWVGKNGKYYFTNWGGNGYTGGRSIAAKSSNAFKWAGRVVFVISTAYSVSEVYSGIKEGDKEKAISATGDILIGVIMTFGGPIGFFVGAGAAVIKYAAENGYIHHSDMSIMPDGSSRWGLNGTTCFVAGTKILMADGSNKNIENVIPGDVILSVDTSSMTIEKDTVIFIPEKINEYRVIEATFENGVTNKFSPAHPYWVLGKGWCVFDVEEAKTELNFSVGRLEKGDVVFYYDNGELVQTTVVSIKDTGKTEKMYNVEFVKNNHSFFANGILVHNKFIEPKENQNEKIEH